MIRGYKSEAGLVIVTVALEVEAAGQPHAVEVDVWSDDDGVTLHWHICRVFGPRGEWVPPGAIEWHFVERRLNDDPERVNRFWDAAR